MPSIHSLKLIGNRINRELLVEIFPSETFTLDYQLQAELSDVKHFAFDAVHGVIHGANQLSGSIGGKCIKLIKPYDSKGKLNSLVPDLNVTLFVESLTEAIFHMYEINGKQYPPASWNKNCFFKMYRDNNHNNV